MPGIAVMERSCPYGWYGKLPLAGDFLRSGLSPQFVDAWDTWAQGLLLAGRDALGEQWQDCYLGAAIWRFALPPGTCGATAVAGIMMPSVDRVGRQFPLCLAAETNGSAWTAFVAMAPAFDRLEDTALHMLDDGVSQSDLADALATLPRPQSVSPPHVKLAWGNRALTTTAGPERALAGLAMDEGATLWTTCIGKTDRILLADGMPRGRDAARALFDLNAPIWLGARQDHRQ